MKLDLHVHTKYSVSDGVLEPGMCIKIAKKKKLDGIAITDHNTIKGAMKARKLNSGKDFEIIVGSEIKTRAGEIIGLYLEDEIRSVEPSEVIREIKSQNGLVIIPHPFDEMRSSSFQPTENDVDDIDAVEVFNSRCIFQKYNDIAHEYTKIFNLSQSAGSDAHFGHEIGNAGIITETENVRDDLIENKLTLFKHKSTPLNLGFTKIVKLLRKI
jgi:predicted metal-dependent phosphoesterase TrpH